MALRASTIAPRDTVPILPLDSRRAIANAITSHTIHQQEYIFIPVNELTTAR